MKLSPALIERPWAGNRLRTLLEKGTPEGQLIGESWELSDHPDAPSGFQEPPFAGKSFGEVFRSHSSDLFNVPTPIAPFPFLIKFIDAGENLSIQVHPGKDAPDSSPELSKSECWYVIDCKPGSHVLCGFRKSASSESLRAAARTGDFDEVLERRPIRPGTFINVPAGTVHAILKGTLICEISQTSSAIARLWDWERPTQEDRKIDIDAAVRYARFDRSESTPDGEIPYVLETADTTGIQTLVRNRHFEVRLLALAGGDDWQCFDVPNPHGIGVTVVRGSGLWACNEGTQRPIQTGETWLLPAGLNRLRIKPGAEDLRLLLSSAHSFDTQS